MMEKLRLIEEKFWARAEKTPTCWLWPGRPDAWGYGSISITWEGKRVRLRAHRVAFSLHHGRMPGEELIRHTCDNPACIRPQCLLAGTAQDNVRDRVERGRCARGERNGRAKLTAEMVQDIRAALAAGHRIGPLSREYAVHYKTISAIRPCAHAACPPKATSCTSVGQTAVPAG